MWAQPAAAEKLRREVARLAGEVERLDKEVQRQKALRCSPQAPCRSLFDPPLCSSLRLLCHPVSHTPMGIAFASPPTAEPRQQQRH